MSVQSNITRIEGAKSSLKTSINNKLNATQQKITNEHIEDYPSFVDQIAGGGGVGTIEITENGIYDISDYANAYVKITELVPCTSVSFNKATLEFEEEGTTSDVLIATFAPLNTTDAIVWNSDNVTVASVTRISGTDTATVAYVGDGTCHITATCGDYTATCTVTCTSEIHCTSVTLDQHTLTLDEPEQDIPCTAITLDKSTASVGTGETITVTATLTPLDTTDTLTVTSSDTTKATVTLSGNVATITGVADGSANITFTCGDQTATCALTIATPIPIARYDVGGEYTKALLSDIDSSKRIRFTSYVQPANTTSIPLVSDSTSSDSTIAEVTGTDSGSYWKYYVSIKPKLGQAILTFAKDGKYANPRVVEVVDTYNDGDLVARSGVQNANGMYDSHILRYVDSPSYRTFVYKVTPGDTYHIHAHMPKTPTNLTVHPISDFAYNLREFTLVGDSNILQVYGSSSAATTVDDDISIPAGANFIIIQSTNAIKQISLVKAPANILTASSSTSGKRVYRTGFSSNSNMTVNFYEITPGTSYDIISGDSNLGASWGSATSTSGTNEDYAYNTAGGTFRIHTSSTSHYLAVSTSTSHLGELFVIEVPTVACTDVKAVVDKDTISVGEQTWFCSVSTPFTSTDVVHFTSSDSSVCTLEANAYTEGNITGVSAGTSTVTVTCGSASSDKVVTVV